MGEDPTRVAIACQGGGSHTAFTAGMLRGLLRDWPEEHELVGLSGTSGGAFTALTAWYGMRRQDPQRAIELLESVWLDLAATGWGDRLANDGLVLLTRLESMGVPFPQVSPYQNPTSHLGGERIERVLTDHIDFEAIPGLCGKSAPELVVGTVDIEDGAFHAFVNEEVTPEAIRASAAVPTLFRAVEVEGHHHWDGLFSQNPPVDDLLTIDAERKPDELWVVQINPQGRDGVPQTMDEITDRRNELAGNLSLNQELRFVERVNEWIDEGYLPREDFARATVRRISMGRALNAATKVDRRPAFIRELLSLGERQAERFLDGYEPVSPGS